MSIIEQATKRLEELRRAGVDVPWAAAGLAESDFKSMVAAKPEARNEPTGAAHESHGDSIPAGVLRRVELLNVNAAKPPVAATVERSSAPASGLPMLELNQERLAAAGYLVPTLVRSDLAKEFRQIKRPLLKNARSGREAGDMRASLIMVSSALPGEGKTFCAINLAMSIAMEVDTSVLLVDADVVRPAVLDRLGLEERKGLLDLLTHEELGLEDLLLTTNIPKLSILPAGTPNQRSTELLASGAMEDLLVKLSNSGGDRVVIFDAPPLLLTTEASVLASRVGQVVMVVDGANTSRANVMQAFASVESCPVVMSVLNKTAAADELGGYRYYYQ